MKNRIKAGILGFVVADALGVPAEFKSRQKLMENPVTDMTGFGTHKQPLGTWSDDSSMTIATMSFIWRIHEKFYQKNYCAYSLFITLSYDWL